MQHLHGVPCGKVKLDVSVLFSLFVPFSLSFSLLLASLSFLIILLFISLINYLYFLFIYFSTVFDEIAV